MKENIKYPGCYWCDNIIDYYGYIGLLHLGFPRCFIIVPDSSDFELADYKAFREHIADIQWLDPSEEWSNAAKEEVITKLWNFSVEYDRENERMYEEDKLIDRMLDDE